MKWREGERGYHFGVWRSDQLERKKERASSSFLLRDSDNANFIYGRQSLSYDHPTLGPMPGLSYIYNIIGPDPNTI